MPIELVKASERRHRKGSFDATCCLCGSNKTVVRSDGVPIWKRDLDIEGRWTGLFICYNCYYKKEKICRVCGVDKKRYPKARISKHYDTFGYWTGDYICYSCLHKIKTRNERNKLSLSTAVGKQLVGEVIVSKVLDIPVGTIYRNGQKLPFSLEHDDYGIISVKTAKLRRGKWYFRTDKTPLADIYFCIGFDAKWQNVEIVYTIPNNQHMKGIAGFYIYREGYRNPEYEWFKTDPEIYNDVYHNIAIAGSGIAPRQ